MATSTPPRTRYDREVKDLKTLDEMADMANKLAILPHVLHRVHPDPPCKWTVKIVAAFQAIPGGGGDERSFEVYAETLPPHSRCFTSTARHLSNAICDVREQVSAWVAAGCPANIR